MNRADSISALWALAMALAGALGASALGLPAAALLGSTFVVTLAALAGLHPHVPSLLRNIAFLVIGVTLGSGVTPHFLSDIAQWPVSIGLLFAAIMIVMFISSWMLRNLFGVDMRTSILATSPGALSYTLSLAAGGVGDIRSVIVLQSLRLLVITMLLPLMVGSIGAAAGAGGAMHDVLLSLPVGLGVLLLAYGVGMIAERLSMPTAFLLSGLLVSGAGHALGILSGRLADPMTFLGFTIAGAVIGTRFSGISFAELRRLGLAGLIVSVMAVAVSAGFSLAVALLSDLPFGQVWVAFAPGGVEAMSSMGLALGYDPVFVATHHVFRIVLLIIALPIMLRLFTRTKAAGPTD